MEVEQEFCLRWNNHKTNIMKVFEELLEQENFVDVTLACEGRTLKAHKIVLSSCSFYFRDILLENPCQHPVIILKDVKFEDIKILIDYMYRGEVTVSQDRLTTLLNVAESLRINSLNEISETASSEYKERDTLSLSHPSQEDLPESTSLSQKCPSRSPMDGFNGYSSPPATRRSKRLHRNSEGNQSTAMQEALPFVEPKTELFEPMSTCERVNEVDVHLDKLHVQPVLPISQQLCHTVGEVSQEIGNNFGSDRLSISRDDVIKVEISNSPLGVLSEPLTITTNMCVQSSSYEGLKYGDTLHNVAGSYANVTPSTSSQTFLPNKELCSLEQSGACRSDSTFPNRTSAPGFRPLRTRIAFMRHQLKTLESHFDINPYPDSQEFDLLIQRTGLSKRAVKVWFQNARAKCRKKKQIGD